MKFLDTRKESTGAEFLVLGHLLIEGVLAFKYYANYPGYDILAVNPDKKLSCRIQVKSRWATDYNRSFPINNFNCDFVVLVALNRGYRYRKKSTKKNAGIKAPQYYVLPVKAVRSAQDKKSKWKTVPLCKIKNLDGYLDNWSLIKKYLKI